MWLFAQQKAIIKKSFSDISLKVFAEGELGRSFFQKASPPCNNPI